MLVRAAVVVAVIGALGTGTLVRAESPWKRWLPQKKVEADPRRDYAFTADNGPWTIMAASFSGDGAAQQARDLVLELRRDYNLPAYTYRKKFDLSRPVEGRGLDKYGNPLQMKYKRAGAGEEIAVLVGDYPAVDAKEAQAALQKIKQIEPKAVSLKARTKTSQTLAGLRAVQRALAPSDSEKAARGPMGSAFLMTSPLLPSEYFAPKGVDKLVVDMNKKVKYGLLDCPGRYTVKVATFSGTTLISQKLVNAAENGQGTFKSRLAEAAERAHKLTEALRAKGVEAYEFHDRYQSIVTVGSFNSVGTPRADGKTEINPAIHSIMKTYGAETAGKPKDLAGIPFDVQPMPVEVPKRALSADYARTASR